MNMVEARPAARFLKSALTEAGESHNSAGLVAWLEATRRERPQVVRPIPLGAMEEWSFERESGDLVHRSGRFFRITGLEVATDLGQRLHWTQPIIDQPEIGILGIIARDIDGVLHLLMQAKMEPGNPLGIQLTPTVQATRSNYTQVHRGTRPLYLDYFLERHRYRVLVDQLQWEHGSAFIRKRNRNMVILVDHEIPVEPGFEWLTLGQVKGLLKEPNIVSMDTRTVVACMPVVGSRGGDNLNPLDLDRASDFGRAALESLASPESASSDEEIMSWITDLKCRHHLRVEDIGLSAVSGWRRSEMEIAPVETGFFKIVAVDVESTSREVTRWTQPMIAAGQQGTVGLLITEIGGVLHALVRARAEPGGADTIILGPTVQSAVAPEAADVDGPHNVITELVKSAVGRDLRYACHQSEEGGRFYRVVSDYRIVQVEGGGGLTVPPDCIWMTFRQLQEMVRYGLLSVEARSLLACLSFT